uniref:Uncharacterized protein n=1 Tax=Panagrolaimus superbus TaxID=310955 RepID=A0A914XYN3_9BILA
MDMSKCIEQPPSAPNEEDHHVSASGPIQNQANPSYPTMTTSSSPPNYGATNQPDYHQPPPSYNDALNYPQVNPPSQMPKPYTPQTEIPTHGAYPQPNSSIYDGAPLGVPSIYEHYNPPPAVTVITPTVQPTGNSFWDRQDQTDDEDDFCYLVCFCLVFIIYCLVKIFVV